MRISPRQIRKLIESEKGKISDKEIFSGPKMSAYLTDFACGLTNRYKRPVRVQVTWDEQPGAAVAFTNGASIHINAASEILTHLPSRQLRLLYMQGTVGHECGHILYTDFVQMKLFQGALSAGKLYPCPPEELSPTEALALLELEDIGRGSDRIAKQVILSQAFDYWNIMEDYYVNAQMCDRFKGSVRSGILLSNDTMLNRCLSIHEQIKKGLPPLSIIHNLLLQYALSGTVNNLGDYDGEYMDKLLACTGWIDEAVMGDAKARLQTAGRLLLHTWSYIKSEIERVREMMPPPSDPDTSVDAEETAASGKRIGLSGSEDLTDEEYEALVSAMGHGRISGAEAPDGEGRPTLSSGDPDAKEEYDNAVAEALRATRAEGGRIPLRKTDTLSEGNGDGGTEENTLYSGSGYTRAGSDINRLLSDMAEEKVSERIEKQISEELQAEADKVRLGNAHAGINIRLNRLYAVDENLITQYNLVAAPLLALSKQLEQEAFPDFADRCIPHKRKGLVSGSTMDTARLYRKDGLIFSKTKYPMEEQDMAVALCVDESGSMFCGNRITAARATSVVLYHCCVDLGIPILICGHTFTGRDTLEIQSYAEFDSIDGNDKYRLMDIAARDNNRDGAALRYTCERLLQRPENRKLLFILSDGQPAAPGYSGTEAEADMRGIVQEYTRAGITFLAAAIGDDHDNIRRIYGASYLDATNLKKLPAKLARLLFDLLQK